MEKRLIKFFTGIFILIFILSSVSATRTMIKLKTLQFHDVEIAVADGTTTDFLLIQRFKGQADKYGDINFTIDSQKSSVNLYVYLKRNNEKITEKKLLDIDNNGKPIEIELIPEGYEAIQTPKFEELDLNKTNENLEENKTIIEVQNVTGFEETNSKFTGAAIKDIISKKIIYIIVGALMLLIILFTTLRLILRRSLSGGDNGEIRIRKLSEVKSDVQDRIEDRMKLIEEAEKKIKEAQNEINKIKNEEKIKEIRKRIENEERELKRLSEGGQQ